MEDQLARIEALLAELRDNVQAHRDQDAAALKAQMHDLSTKVEYLYRNAR